MGLSRKLGGATNSRAEVPCHVDCTWSTQSYTMRDILTKFRLPCVVQCSGDAGTVLWADFHFDMRQPLLLYAARTVRKVHARSLKVREPSGDLEEFGPPLAIPEDYDGWFFPVGRKDPTVVPRHTRVEGAAASSNRQFLVTTTLPAFSPAKGANSGGKHVQHEVTIGEVLTKVGVMKGEPTTTHSPSPSALVQRSRQSLRCVDENKHEVIIPFSHRGLLYDVAENYGPPNKNTIAGAGNPQPSGPSTPGSIHTSTLVAVGNKYLPRVFRHILGELPALAHAFTGILRCYSVFTEETVMAATMSRTNLYSMSRDSSCLELATDSSAKFKIALNGNELKKTHQYALALKTCEEQAPSYVRAIKTSFTLQPVVDIEDVDVSLYERGLEKMKESPLTGSAAIHGAVQKSSSDACVEGENSSTGVLHLDTDTGVTDTCDDESLATDDVCDEESDTDDIPTSVMDSASVSDATDMYGDSVSDIVEVEANSEFDFTWGQLKRAKSFTGSISTLTDSGTESTSSSDSESEESEHSMTTQERPDSSVSGNSTLTKGGRSSTSEDTVVLRTSAPSPVYANVPKKLSIYSPEQPDSDAFVTDLADIPDTCVTDLTEVSNALDSMTDPFADMTDPSDVPNTVDGRGLDVVNADIIVHDNTVRSVWNITPTVDGPHERDQENHQITTRDGAFPDRDSMEGTYPIWWGDCTENLDDGNAAILDFKQRHSGEDESDSSTLEHPNIPNKPTIVQQTQVCPKPSIESVTGSQLSFSHHSLLSAKSSAHSEGSTQDLAIQRLERALNDATSFLKSSQPTHMKPIPPPRRMSDSVDIHVIDEVNSGQFTAGQYDGWKPASFDTAGSVHSSQTSTAASSLETVRNPFSLSTSKQSLSDHQTYSFPDHQTHSVLDRNSMPDHETVSMPNHQTQRQIITDFGNQNRPHTRAAHHQSDSHLNSDRAAQKPAAHHQSDGQIDLDFVKALGDRLMAVSRKSSLPKYQRLQHDLDFTLPPENQNGSRQFRKKKQRAGILPSYMAQGGVDGGGNGDECGDSTGTVSAAFSQDWDGVDFTQKDAILNDLDLLQEEAV